jgi:hypothetical protein
MELRHGDVVDAYMIEALGWIRMFTRLILRQQVDAVRERLVRRIACP